MEVSYKLTQDDFYEAFVAHRNGTRSGRWVVRIVVAAAVLLTAATGYILVTFHDKEMFWAAVPLFLFGAFPVNILWLAPRLAARNQFKKQPLAHHPATLTVTSEAMQWRTADASSETRWAGFIRWIESKNEILLYPQRSIFLIIPKRAFSPNQLPELRSRLRENVKDGKRK